MHYLLLDTNIYLDLLFWRDRSAPPDTLSYLTQILSNPAIRLVVPDIIEHEFKRNAAQQLAACRDTLSRLVALCEIAPYPHLAGAEEFRLFLDRTVQELGSWKRKLGNDTLLNDHIRQFEDLLAGDHVIRVSTDPSVLQGVMNRRIFKRCPFHRENKEEYADAAIAEMLVTLKHRVPFAQGDEITFLSRNTEDFCDIGNRDVLHTDLLADLKSANMIVHYSRYAYKTLKEQFNVPVAPDVLEVEQQTVEQPGVTLPADHWFTVSKLFQPLAPNTIDKIVKLFRETSPTAMDKLAETFSPLSPGAAERIVEAFRSNQPGAVDRVVETFRSNQPGAVERIVENLRPNSPGAVETALEGVRPNPVGPVERMVESLQPVPPGPVERMAESLRPTRGASATDLIVKSLNNERRGAARRKGGNHGNSSSSADSRNNEDNDS